VELLGLAWAFTLKENQPELLREANASRSIAYGGCIPSRAGRIRVALAGGDWPVADRPARVVKTVRIEHLHRVTVSEKDGHRIKSKTEVTQESTNFYATKFRTLLGLAIVHPSVRPQPLANRYGSFSNHHH
jgi:hypothetical protein